MQINTMISQLSGGMLVSTEIFVVTLVFSLPLGLLIAFGRMSKNKVLQGIVKTYISIMRGTPLMLQLMVVYFGPFYLFGIKIKSKASWLQSQSDLFPHHPAAGDQADPAIGDQ